MKYRYSVLAGLVGLVSLLLLGCQGLQRSELEKLGMKDYVPQEYQADFAQALELSGKNTSELVVVMKSVTPEMRKGTAFIISTMSYPDLVAIKSDVLLEHIRYAYLIKSKYPWMNPVRDRSSQRDDRDSGIDSNHPLAKGQVSNSSNESKNISNGVKDMPEEIFLHYVLPYRCAEEPIEPYRKYFYEQLDPIVSQLTTMADVAHQVNLWLGAPKADGKSRVRFVQTEARDQGPIETLKSGYGRCEEMMIVYMAAARSVGIPCRSAWTPYWAICDNNHAWVEVWVDGYWKPLGGCEPGGVWFEHPAKRAAAVYSAAIGRPKTELVHKTDGNTTIINSTPNYSRICNVKVKVLSQEGKPMHNMNVVFSVFNWGSFRPFATRITDSEGIAHFITGIGEYFLSTGKDNLRAWQVVNTEADKTLEIVLQLTQDHAPDGFLFLRYPTPEQAKMSFSTLPLVPMCKTPITPTYQPPPEIYIADVFSPELHSDIIQLINTFPKSDAILQKIKSSGGNWREITNAIKQVAQEQRQDLFHLITQLIHLDTLEVTTGFLLENVDYATIARQKAKWQVPDDIYYSYILSPLFRYLHLSEWRKELYIAFTSLPADRQVMKDNITDTARAVNNWVESNIKLQPVMGGRFSHLASPLNTYYSSRATAYGSAVFTAGILRTLAIPTQVKNDWVEFYNGTNWLPLYPHDSKNFANIKRDEKTQTEYGKPAGLKLNLIRKGQVDTNPWEKIAVCRFENGFWGYLEDLKHYGKWQAIPPGTYLVTAGVRDSNGNVMAYCKQLTFKPEEGIVIDLPMDIPLSILPEKERLARSLQTLPSFELTDLNDKVYNSTEILKNNSLLLVFFSLDNEPSVRMLPLIEQAQKTLKDSGVVILAVYIDASGKDKFLSDSRLRHTALPVLLDSKQEVVKQFIPDFEKDKNKCLPSTLLI
ncbi:MAG: transglutaminase domain-containing protein, partial [Planctomycetota bacterium]|nr:transglutaminase domain-containing protein [Planctomycetota bacterium]